MVYGKDTSSLDSGNVKKTLASGRIFSTNMQDYCKHLQRLLCHVYRKIYGDQTKCLFLLVPMPRLEVEQISDLQILHEIGALTPDVSMSLSRTLLGESIVCKKQKLPQAGGAQGYQMQDEDRKFQYSFNRKKIEDKDVKNNDSKKGKPEPEQRGGGKPEK